MAKLLSLLRVVSAGPGNRRSLAPYFWGQSLEEQYARGRAGRRAPTRSPRQRVRVAREHAHEPRLQHEREVAQRRHQGESQPGEHEHRVDPVDPLRDRPAETSTDLN